MVYDDVLFLVFRFVGNHFKFRTARIYFMDWKTGVHGVPEERSSQIFPSSFSKYRGKPRAHGLKFDVSIPIGADNTPRVVLRVYNNNHVCMYIYIRGLNVKSIVLY